MPLNYSKWDNLELSDDSDIEEHPNVDKKSMIRWKQRDIHEKREARKLQIAKYKSELSLNSVLRPRIEVIIKGVADKGLDHYRSVQRRLKENPSDEKPNTGSPNQPTYDMMISQLLSDVYRESSFIVDGAQISRDGQKRKGLEIALEQRLNWHIQELDKRDKVVKDELEKEEKEQAKKITSEGIHDGWSKSMVNKPKPSPLDDKPKILKSIEKEKTETIEVLNPKSVEVSSFKLSSKSAAEEEKDEEEEDFGPLTPSARAFANIPIGAFEKSFAFIQKDSSVLTESTHDSLLAEAFDAERRGDKDLAKRCVHQSLLINYCRQLGRDGVGLFFQKMISHNPKSIEMFVQDFNQTYSRIAQRTAEMIAEEAAAGEREQIQLVAEDPSMEIGFNLPEGPPPDDLRLEGEGTEEMDIEQVKLFLQRKWDIFQNFPESFRNALKTEKLDEVNKVLGKMKVAEAEEVVELLQEGGMLSFSEKGVRDMTQGQ
ncbi:cell division cycle protein 37 [Kwoniella mangroviensis CBS 10435]|uniref:Hsp90 chaperone protein kinase-targeting subunit n=1 Tax=Kwoniella mangroviensis CBS 10435 TaxID=1331196 RepID=A0A1B9IUH0_9TREE|nr:cell division cycle protein 37 [Kwoniella mangroviensis CBS 10435]